MPNIALAGVAHIHTPGFIETIKSRAEFNVKYLWDRNTARAEARGTEWGLSVIRDPAATYNDPELDAIIVCSETTLHEQIVLPAASSHKALFVEKPLGSKSADAYRMARAIDDAKVLFQTGYFMRGDPRYIFLKSEIEKGSFGQITRVRASVCHDGALGHWFDTDWRWMADPAIAGVGAFGDLGTHALDILLWLLGDVEKATAILSIGTGAYEGCDETGEGLIQFKNGAIGTLAAAWDDIANPVNLLLSGTEGHAVIFNGDLYYKTSRIPGADGTRPWLDLPLPESSGFDAFLDAISGKSTPSLVSPSEAAYRSAVMEALYEGAENSKWASPVVPC